MGCEITSGLARSCVMNVIQTKLLHLLHHEQPSVDDFAHCEYRCGSNGNFPVSTGLGWSQP